MRGAGPRHEVPGCLARGSHRVHAGPADRYSPGLEGKKPGWQHLPGGNGDRDLQFFDAALAGLRKKYAIDDKRVYATGFSNGGFFTYLLWTRAPMSSPPSRPTGHGLPREPLKLTVPKPAFIVAGKEDKLMPIADQEAAIKRVRQLDSPTADGDSRDNGTTVYKSEKGRPW